MPDDWKEALITPIIKREKMSNYTGSKMYISILNERIDKAQISEKAEALLTTNHEVDKRLCREKWKLQLFIDLGAMFGSVSREIIM